MFYAEEMEKRGLSASGVSSSNTRTSIKTFLEQNPDTSREMNREIMTIKQLRFVLETKGIFLSHGELTNVFKEIENKDESKALTLQGLVDFVYTKQNTISTKQKALAIIRRCFRNIGFWTSTSYVFGVFPFIIADFVEGPLWIKHLYGLGCGLFLIGAVGGLINLYHTLSDDISAMDRIDAKLRGVAVKVGMLVTLFDRKLIRMSTVRGVNNDHVKLLSSRDIARFQKEGAMDLFELAGGKTKIKESELYDFFFDLGTLKEVNRDTRAMLIFCTTKLTLTIVSNAISLYSGIPLSVEDCKKLWHKIGPDTDGQLQCVSVSDMVLPIDFLFAHFLSFLLNL